MTLTAAFAVVAGNSDLPPTGTVTFMDAGTPLGTGALNGQLASWTGTLPGDIPSITATYDGDNFYTAGTSSPPLTPGTPRVTITAPGGTPSPLPTNGSASAVTVSAVTNADSADYPYTRFAVDFSGIDGLTASQLRLQQDIAGQWSDVALTDGSPGHLIATVGTDGALHPSSSSSVSLKLSARAGSPLGDLTMVASLLSSNDDGTTYPDVYASPSQVFTLTDQVVLTDTTTTVTAGSVLTTGPTGATPMTATITPVAATGSVEFSSDGVVVDAAPLVNGIAAANPSLALGSHSISATYDGDNSYNGSTGTQALQITVTPPGGSLHAILPVRILDTRPATHIGVVTPGPLAAGATLVLQVTGAGGIPSSGVLGISVNVTVVQPVAAGYLTLYPTGGTVPGTANIDFPKLVNTSGLVITPLSAAGRVSILNKSTGPISLIADVSAWFAQQTGPWMRKAGTTRSPRFG